MRKKTEPLKPFLCGYIWVAIFMFVGFLNKRGGTKISPKSEICSRFSFATDWLTSTSFYSISSSARSWAEKEEMVSEIPFALIFYSIHKNPTKIQVQSGMEKVIYSSFKLYPRTVEWCLLSQRVETRKCGLEILLLSLESEQTEEKKAFNAPCWEN